MIVIGFVGVRCRHDPVIFKSVPAGTIQPVHAAILALTGIAASNIIALC